MVSSNRIVARIRLPSKLGLVMMRVRIWCTRSNICTSPD